MNTIQHTAKDKMENRSAFQRIAEPYSGAALRNTVTSKVSGGGLRIANSLRS